MNCAACGHENRAGRKFCVECGAALALACAACAAPYEIGEKFCGECGAPLGTARPRPPVSTDTEGSTRAAPIPRAPADAGARKVVTIVFADLVGSTALHERLDAESARRVMERYYEALRGVVDAHGGTVVKLLGDGVMAAFGLRQVAEDDAVRAVRAAVAMQEAFRRLVREQAAGLGGAGLRVGVNTGEVVVSGAQDDVIGDPVNVAARLQEQGRDGDVVVGEATRRLVATRVTLAPLGSVVLKGRAEAVAAYRVESLDPPAAATATPFVGREDELARLRAVYETAVAVQAARLAVLLGSPGLGKSRLIDELGGRLGDAVTLLGAHCDAAGGTTFAPLAMAFRALLGIDDTASSEEMLAAIESALSGDDTADRARIAGGIAALLAGSPASPEETFFVVRRLLGALARSKPVVLVIDDLHWAEPLLLDLVEHLVQWGSGVALFVLVGARPELRDVRSALVTPGGLVTDVVTLGGLDAGAAMRLAANVIGASDLPAAVAAKVLATSEGNPLFVGELVRMLVQEGALTKEGERWTVGAGLASIEMPPTIHALLAARIERLRPEERTVLERASVVGRHFSRSAVAALLGRNGGDLDARLESLRRSELIERDTGWLLGEPVLRFHHVLIRDAAYRRLLKGTRAELHERLADWIEGQVGDAPEHDETIGWHFEQAHRHLRELGPLDARGKSLGERAASRLAAAGRRALARDDVPLAAGLLGRAIDRLDADDPARADLALDWCEALLSAGDVVPAAKAIDELARFLPNPRLSAWHTCFSGQLTALTAPQALQATAESVATAAEDLAKLGDAAGEAKAHSVHAQALARLGNIGACEAALDKALAAARKAGDRRRANAVLAGAPVAALWGPSPVTRASGRCLDVVRVLRITQGAPAVEAVALSCQGVLEALRGRTDAARRMIASSRKMVEELGIAHRLFEADVFAGRIDLLEGDAAAAERNLRGAYDGLRELGLGIDAARAGALLARAQLAQGTVAEAESLSRESEALAGDDLQAAIAWRGVRAEALALRGETKAAVELAQAAVAIAATTDALLDHADARLALAAALRASGRSTEADAEERRAIELWEAKGASLLAERARRTGTRVAPPASAPEPRSAPVVRRRIGTNAAVARQAAFDVAFAARDDAALEDMFARFQERVDHATGAVYGRDGLLASLRSLLRSKVPVLRFEPLAILGDRLDLVRQWTSVGGTTGGGFDVAAFEREEILLGEVDDDGRILRTECFAADHLGDAIARLYERHAELLPEAPARERAGATARSVAALLGPFDLDRFAMGIASALDFVDHRHVGLESSRGAEAWLRGLRSLLEVADGVTNQAEDVLALRPDALLARWRNFGTDRVGGGAYERHFLWLGCFGPDGLLARIELFEVERDAEALARFDELVGVGSVKEAPVRRRVRPNAASAVMARLEAAFAVRDLAAIDALLGERMENVDHPTGSTYGREGQIESSKRMLRTPDLSFRVEPLATLGESLCLARRIVAARGTVGGQFDVAEYEMEHLAILELDEVGRCGHFEVFAPNRLGDAMGRFYERYAERLPEGPARVRAATTARSVGAMTGLLDHERMASAIAPAVEVVDRRILGTWFASGADALLQHVDSWLEVGDAHRAREDEILDLRFDALLIRRTVSGTDREGGGTFDGELLVLWVFGGDGRLTRWELFDVDREAEAMARLDELASAIPAPQRFPNAATRALDRGTAALGARDWEVFASLFAAEFRVFDRTPLAQLEADREQWLAAFREMVEMTSGRPTQQVLATRGDRLAVFRVLWRGAAGDIGPSEVEWLLLIEVDGRGDHLAVVSFDPDDLDAAYAELDARWVAGDAAAHPLASKWLAGYRRALAARDWIAMAAILAPDLVSHSHRLVSWGTLHGPAGLVSTLLAQMELAPDTRARFDHVRACEGGVLLEYAWLGTRDGGAFEIVFVAVVEIDALGRARRIDVWDAEQPEQVRARFEALCTGVPPDPLAAIAKRNAAMMERWKAAFDAGFDADDWEAMRQLCAGGMIFADRRRLALLSGDGELMIASARERARTGARPEVRVVGTAGDRVVVGRSVWSGGPPDGRFEIEYFSVVEVDEAGLLTAMIFFDADDPLAAQREAWARWAAIDPASAAVTTPLGEGLDAFNARDRARIRAVFADDLVVEDHRRKGMGRLEGADAYAESVAALWELAPASRIDGGWFWPAYARHGAVTVNRRSGTLADGGSYESEFLWLFTVARGRITRVEMFELEDLDAAVARLEELRPDPLRIPSNAATSWNDR